MNKAQQYPDARPQSRRAPIEPASFFELQAEMGGYVGSRNLLAPILPRIIVGFIPDM
jgi:hypothetical protein